MSNMLLPHGHSLSPCQITVGFVSNIFVVIEKPRSKHKSKQLEYRNPVLSRHVSKYVNTALYPMSLISISLLDVLLQHISRKSSCCCCRQSENTQTMPVWSQVGLVKYLPLTRITLMLSPCVLKFVDTINSLTNAGQFILWC